MVRTSLLPRSRLRFLTPHPLAFAAICSRYSAAAMPHQMKLAPSVSNRLKERLDRDEVGSSMSIKLCTSVEIVGLAKAAGYEAILIDMEHNAFSLSTTNQASR